MLAFMLFTAVFSAGGVGLLGAMHTRRDSYLGALGLMALCLAGLTGAAYGVLNSAA